MVAGHPNARAVSLVRWGAAELGENDFAALLTAISQVGGMCFLNGMGTPRHGWLEQTSTMQKRRSLTHGMGAFVWCDPSAHVRACHRHVHVICRRAVFEARGLLAHSL